MEVFNCMPTEFSKMWLTFNGSSPLKEIAYYPKYRIQDPQYTFTLHHCKYQPNCKEVFHFFNAQVFIFIELFLLES